MFSSTKLWQNENSETVRLKQFHTWRKKKKKKEGRKKRKDKLLKITWISQYMSYKYTQKETQIQVLSTGGHLALKRVTFVS